MNEEQFPLELTTDDVETILETTALLTQLFIPIHNQVGDATSISTSSSPYSGDLEDVQFQMSISAASRCSNFPSNFSEFASFPALHHDDPERKPILASAPNGSSLCPNFCNQIEDIGENPESFVENRNFEETVQEFEKQSPILA